MGFIEWIEWTGLTMRKDLKRRGTPPIANIDAGLPGRQPISSPQDVVNITAAVDASHVSTLFGRPFPIQFRHQGAIDAWVRALSDTELWRRWQEPNTPYRRVRNEIAELVELIYPTFMVIKGEKERAAAIRRLLEATTGASLKYLLNKGTVIEVTPSLETLLTNSDLDLSLPMSMVAPPYRAQYLRFGDTAMRYLEVPHVNASNCVYDGVFCFFNPDTARSVERGTRWTLELVFVIKRQDGPVGFFELLGDTDRGSITLGEWLDKGLTEAAGQDLGACRQPTHAAVNYVVKVFLYMALKHVRVTEHWNYEAALRRAAGLGERKRVKLLQKAASLYDSIVVGPEPALPSAATDGAGSGVAPHWRRGHFRMQAFGVGKQNRKLIFIAPTLIHADQLHGDTPAPKSYQAGSGVLSSA
jgi:hypothetical protein